MKRFLTLLICLLIASFSYAQKSKNSKRAFNKSNNEKETFLKKQWWIGLRGGANFSQAVVQKQYYIVTPSNYALTAINKKYESFKEPGSEVAIEITFSYKNLGLSFQPSYYHVGFNYTNEYHWISSAEGGRFDMNYKQIQRMDYLDFPLLGKMVLTQTKLRPYLQGGFYMSRLLGADKTIEITKTDYASGGANEIQDDPIIVGATDLFAKKHWGLIGGGGLYYTLGNVRLNLDFQYKYGMSNISSTKNRYASDRLSGVGDSLDDIKLNTIAISLGCLFPLRFLENSFKSVGKK
jgi:hypothetical protein